MRKSLFFRLRALAGLSGLVRHREGRTPLTIHPKAAKPTGFTILGRTEPSIDAPLAWIGKYNARTRLYEIPLELEGNDGHSIRPALSIARPLCRIEGYTFDELDIVNQRLHSRTYSIALADFSETVTLFGTVNGHSIFSVPLSPMAKPIALACYSNGLTPCQDLSALGATEFGCMISEDGMALRFRLGEEIATLDAMKANLRTTDLVVVYVRDIEELIFCNVATPTLPSPMCRISMHDGIQTDITVDYYPVMQGG